MRSKVPNLLHFLSSIEMITHILVQNIQRRVTMAFLPGVLFSLPAVMFFMYHYINQSASTLMPMPV